MKTKSFNQLRLDVLGKAREGGLRVIFSMLLIAIPGGIGHFFDSLFNINGIMFTKDPNNYLDGPFGFLFGIIPKLLGMCIGQLLQIIFDITGVLAHILFDLPISLCFPGFDKLFKGAGQGELHSLAHRYGEIEVGFGAKFNSLPWHMQAPAGFVVGFIPEMIRFAIISFCSIIIGVLHKFFNAISALVKRTKKSVENLDGGHKKKPRARFNDETREKLNQQQQEQRAKQELRNTLQFVIQQRIDLFEILNIKPEKIDSIDVNKQYNRALLKDMWHPDKAQQFIKTFRTHLETLNQNLNDAEANKFFRKLGIDVSKKELLEAIKTDTDEESIIGYQKQGLERAQLAADILQNQDLCQEYRTWYNKYFKQGSPAASSNWRGTTDYTPYPSSGSGKQSPTFYSSRSSSPLLLDKPEGAKQQQTTSGGRKKRIRFV